MSESMDRSLTLGELLKVRLHLSICAWCARYLSQIKILRQVLRLRDEMSGAGPTMPSSLGAEARARILRALEEHGPSQKL